MAKDQKTSALETVPQTTAGGIEVYGGPRFLALNQNIDAMPALLAANIGANQTINEFDMDRVGIPGGGGLAWSVPDINGEPKAEVELAGVILMHGDRRAYWSVSFDDSGGGSPPDCSSLDGRSGTGHILGEAKDTPAKVRTCKLCPMAAWGSADIGLPAGKTPSNGQACTQRKLVFMLRQGDILPLIIDLAPTSIKAFAQFMLRLTSRGVPCYGAVVGFKLVTESSNTGIKYSRVAPRLVSVLSDADTTQMKAISDAMRPYFERTSIEAPITSSM